MLRLCLLAIVCITVLLWKQLAQESFHTVHAYRVCLEALFLLVPAPVRDLHSDMASYAAEHEIQDGPLTFEEACAHVSGQKLQGPEAHPMKSDRAPGDAQISESH